MRVTLSGPAASHSSSVIMVVVRVIESKTNFSDECLVSNSSDIEQASVSSATHVYGLHVVPHDNIPEVHRSQREKASQGIEPRTTRNCTVCSNH